MRRVGRTWAKYSLDKALPDAFFPGDMTESTPDRARLLRRLAWTGAAFALGLIVLGGVVRITGSGMGCGDHWPRCDGEWFPPLDLPTLIEIGHRWAAALVSLLVLAVALVAWRRHRAEPAAPEPSHAGAGAPGGPGAPRRGHRQAGAAALGDHHPPGQRHAAAGHADGGGAPGRGARGPGASRLEARHGAHGLVVATAGLGFVVILFGAQVANFHAGLLCLGFPLCNGGVLPPATALAALHWTHRVLAFAFLGLVLALVSRVSRRTDPAGRRLRPAARARCWPRPWRRSAVAAAMVLHLLPPALRALHLLVGSAGLGRAGGAGVPLAPHAGRRAEPSRGRAGHPAAVASRPTWSRSPSRGSSRCCWSRRSRRCSSRRPGLPTWRQLFWVLRGRLPDGRRRERDQHVVRPGHRHPDGAHAAPADSVRAGSRPGSGWPSASALGLAAFAVFWYRVNPLSAWLALGGLLFYVFVYTIWLKRTSPQNIVIGGAAGAFPPLVGWAAMTGRLDLAAIYLFAIIFYWTPPHFWALALIKQADYARAGIPMMPVVRGEARTKYEMLVYTLMLLPLTVMPTLFGALGPVLRRGGGAAGRAAPVVLHPAPARAVGHAGRVADVPLLAALPRAALRGDGHRPGAAVRPPAPAGKVIILGRPGEPWRCRPPRTSTPEQRRTERPPTHAGARTQMRAPR